MTLNVMTSVEEAGRPKNFFFILFNENGKWEPYAIRIRIRIECNPDQQPWFANPDSLSLKR
jgi:hypothetical protein